MNVRVRSGAVAVVLVLVLALASACAQPRASAAEAAVREYAELLPAVYSRGEPSLLADRVTPAEGNRLQMYLLYLKKEGETLDTRLVDLRVTSVKLLSDGAGALVTTQERWRYRTIDATTGESRTGYVTASYDTEYTLKLQNGAWLVSEVDARETSRQEESSESTPQPALPGTPSVTPEAK